MPKILCTFEDCKRKFKNEAALKAHIRQAHKPKDIIREVKGPMQKPAQNPITELEIAREKLNIPDDEFEPAASSETAQSQEPTKPKLALTISPGLAKSMVKYPFTILAGIVEVPEVALTSQEAEELGYIFKEVWDIYAPEWLQKHGPLVGLAVALTTTIGAKIFVIKEYKQGKQKQQKQEKTEEKNKFVEVDTNAERQKEAFYKKMR